MIKAISEDDGFNADFSGGGVNSEAADVAQKRKQIGERIIYSDTDIPGKYGYLRNMLINTKVIKAAFGVGDDFNVESINVVESLESLFSMLNRDLNFWNFSIITDAKETYRAKIIDEQVVNFEFDRNNPVTKQKSIGIGNDLVTPEGYGTGVFFFPVWRQDSLVKRQNITAKIPDAMQLAVMYGTNFDQLKDLANPGAAFGNKEGVFAGALFNQYADIKNQGADIAFRTETKNRLGTKNGDANEKLSNDGDDIRTFIKKHTGDLELKLEDRLAAINEELNLVDEPELFEGLDFDPAKPPPVIRNLNAEQLGELLQHEKKLGYGTGESDKPLGSLLGSTFQNTGQMKSFFKKSVRFLTTQHGIYKQGNTPLLIPLELELDIDGIGGIYPGNSCHSTYVPQKYQEVTVFQIFDVNHRIGNEGWTVTLASKMRSNLDSVMDGFYTLDELRQQQFKNYFDKATMNERKRLNEIELNEQRMKEIEKKYPGAYGD